MTQPNADGSASPLGRYLICVALLWLAGVGLRLTILAVPPVIPLIHDEFAMSETQVGILSGLPMVLFAAAAVPGSLLIARFGALPTLVVGLLVTALGSALRGAVPDLWLLYAATIVTAFGVAVMQPSLPPLVRAWLPHKIGFGTAVYTNGLLIGEALPVALTIPLVLPLVGGSWRLGFVAWALPCVAVALIVLVAAPRAANGGVGSGNGAGRRWWPDWKSGVIWRLGLMLGSVNAMYFATNGFIPDYLHHIGRPDLISASLSAINVGQLPASFLLLVYAERWVRRVWPYFACGVMTLLAFAGILSGDGAVIVLACGLLGLAAAAILVFMLALPPLLSEPDDIHRMTAGMFTISYSCAVIVPIVSGLAWDLTAVPAMAFIPIAGCALLLMALAPTIHVREADA